MANTVLKWCIPERLTRGGTVLVLNRRDPVVCGAITFGVYETAETKFLRSVFRPGMTFVDVGANIGYYTALAIGRIGQRGKIVALEPDTENFGFLEQTVRANAAENVMCIRKAASDQVGTSTLYVSSQNRGDNRLYRNELCDGSYDVEVSTVDELLAECGVSCVDLVKIDVQGYEGRVVSGMWETIRRSARLIMLMEFWPDGLERAGTPAMQLLNDLEAAGMELLELGPKGSVKPIADKRRLIARYPGRRYTNIVGVRGGAPAALVPRA